MRSTRKPKLTGLLAGIAMSTVATLALAQPAEADVSADDVVDALARAGLPVDLGEDPWGEPEITSSVGGTNFDVLFFDCDGDVCDTVTFAVVYVTSDVSMKQMNDWNIKSLHGRL